MKDDIDDIIEAMQAVGNKALEWANQHYPTASVQHRAAFANSVVYLVTGVSGGGYGGPSLREHLVSWSLGKVGAASMPDGTAITTVTPHPHLPMPGNWDFESACAHAAPLCFGPPEQHEATLLQIWEREYTFDDDPEDIYVLRGKPLAR